RGYGAVNQRGEEVKEPVVTGSLVEKGRNDHRRITARVEGIPCDLGGIFQARCARPGEHVEPAPAFRGGLEKRAALGSAQRGALAGCPGDEHAMTAAPRDVLKTGSELLGRGPPLVVVRGDDCRIDAFQIAHRCDYPLPWWSSSAGKLPRQPPGAVIQSATACVRLPH